MVEAGARGMRSSVYAALLDAMSTAARADHGKSDVELIRRFVETHDESAFEALVRRHGPLVQGVCRRILGDAHNAEDAFQAVFLVLVRKSASIRQPELLANWLYGVAYRIARKARIGALRRQTRERRAGKMATQARLLDLEWVELKTVLDEELSQLPEKYRAPLILCYLCGRTNAEAARQLGWPSGSMSERLSRAREMLRRRLNRRGLTLSAGLLALLLLQKAASADVSPLLVEATIKTGLAGGSKAAAGSVSAAVQELARDAPVLSLARSLTVSSLTLVIALSIGSSWPHLKRVSRDVLFQVRAGLGWNQG